MHKENIRRTEGEVVSHTMIIDKFSTPFLIINRLSRQKNNTVTMDLNNVIDQIT